MRILMCIQAVFPVLRYGIFLPKGPLLAREIETKQKVNKDRMKKARISFLWPPMFHSCAQKNALFLRCLRVCLPEIRNLKLLVPPFAHGNWLLSPKQAPL